MRKCLLVMFALLLLGSLSLADEFFVAGQTNEQLCSLEGRQCPQINFLLYLTAEPVSLPAVGTPYEVLSLVGIVDGQFPIFLADGFATLSDEFGLPGEKPAPNDVPYILDGYQGFFSWIDVGPLPTAFMSWFPGQNSPPADLVGPVTWEIYNVTPEPSTLLSLAIGVLALFGFAIRRRREGLNPIGE
jgi:PEP-CTERM motif